MRGKLLVATITAVVIMPVVLAEDFEQPVVYNGSPTGDYLDFDTMVAYHWDNNTKLLTPIGLVGSVTPFVRVDAYPRGSSPNPLTGRTDGPCTHHVCGAGFIAEVFAEQVAFQQRIFRNCDGNTYVYTSTSVPLLPVNYYRHETNADPNCSGSFTVRYILDGFNVVASDTAAFNCNANPSNCYG